jgi:8-oxo-dGTP diphosphatase
MNRGANRAVVEVAVGVLIRSDGAALLADRPAGKPYAGYWEFPGGKLEAGESVDAALRRELREELGIDIGASLPWVVFEHDYPHAYVRLHFRRVFDWEGEPRSREGQRIGFYRPGGELPAPLLPATVPVTRWLELPDIYAVSNIAGSGGPAFLDALDAALARGLRMVLLREPALAPGELAALAPAIAARVRAAGARALISSRHDESLWPLFDGVQLTAFDLMRLKQRPPARWLAASVHDREQLRLARALGCDFAVLGSVRSTASHPGAAPIGWQRFGSLAIDTPLPLYAIGGLDATDLPQARRAGAHGVALLRAAWR